MAKSKKRSSERDTRSEKRVAAQAAKRGSLAKKKKPVRTVSSKSKRLSDASPKGKKRARKSPVLLVTLPHTKRKNKSSGRKHIRQLNVNSVSFSEETLDSSQNEQLSETEQSIRSEELLGNLAGTSTVNRASSDSEDSSLDSTGESSEETSEEENDDRSFSADDEDLSADDGPDRQQVAAATERASMIQFYTRTRRRGTRFKDAWSDDDPSPDPSPDHNDYIAYTPDEHGWTRNNQTVQVQPFAGEGNPGPTFLTDESFDTFSAESFFYKFFPVVIFSWIAKWTNKVIKATNKTLRTKARKSKRKVVEMAATCEAEIKAWFGLRLVMACVQISNVKNYWSTKRGWKNNLIHDTMSLKRFQNLSLCMALSNPVDNPDSWSRKTPAQKKSYRAYVKKHPVYPVEPTWNLVREMCCSQYKLRREISIDEAMIGYKGTKAKLRRVFMPLKPTRVGFKIYALAESSTGYLANFEYQCESNRKVVDCVMSLIEPFKGQYHHVFTDKYYTSVEVARQLLTKDTYLTGAVKDSSKKLANDLSTNPQKNAKVQRMKDLHHARRGTFYIRQNGNMTYTAWKDSKVLTVLSNAHDAYRDKEKDTVNRKFSIDGIARSEIHTINAPPQVISYMYNYGGVDKADQLRAYYSTARKSNTWHMQLLSFLIDVCQVNAYICFNIAQDPDTTPNHPRFVMNLAEDLINSFREEGRRERQDTRYPRTVRIHDHKHVLMHPKKKLSKACVLCLREGRKSKDGKGAREKRTRYGCAACNKHYCHPCYLRTHPPAVLGGESSVDPSLPDILGDESQRDAAANVQVPPENCSQVVARDVPNVPQIEALAHQEVDDQGDPQDVQQDSSLRDDAQGDRHDDREDDPMELSQAKHLRF
jgi:hypothetical protein